MTLNDPSSWATVAGVAVVFVFFLRLLRTVYPDGTLDYDAIKLVRASSLRPAFVTVGILILCLLAMVLFPAAVPVLVWVIGVVALGGCIWSVERSIRAVRASRTS